MVGLIFSGILNVFLVLYFGSVDWFMNVLFSVRFVGFFSSVSLFVLWSLVLRYVVGLYLVMMVLVNMMLVKVIFVMCCLEVIEFGFSVLGLGRL